MTKNYIGGGMYRIGDAEAGRLARAAGAKRPPSHGRFIIVEYKGKRAELHRTEYRHATDAPKRGWVYAVMPY